MPLKRCSINWKKWRKWWDSWKCYPWVEWEKKATAQWIAIETNKNLYSNK